MTVVEDELRSAVWIGDLVERVMALARSEIQGIRHIPATRIVSRKELAEFLIKHLKLDVELGLECRSQRPVPHIGRIELATRYDDPPLPSVLDRIDCILNETTAGV